MTVIELNKEKESNLSIKKKNKKPLIELKTKRINSDISSSSKIINITETL
jgi:hypothetical protein